RGAPGGSWGAAWCTARFICPGWNTAQRASAPTCAGTRTSCCARARLTSGRWSARSSADRSPPRGAGARTQAEAIAFDQDLIPGTEYAYGPFFRLDSERSAHRRAAPQLLSRRAPRVGAYRDLPVGVLTA